MMAIPLGPDPAVMEAIARGNAVAFFDVMLGEGANAAELGRIKLELFVKDCPKTCENFRQFCTGEFLQNEQPVGYKDSMFHRVIKDFMIQGGDFVHHNGTGKMSIYGPQGFADENYLYRHDGPGVLSMAKLPQQQQQSSTNHNGCQFCIMTKAADWLDGQQVVFGKVLDGPSMLTVRKCEAVPVIGDQPRIPLRIVQCGEL